MRIARLGPVLAHDHDQVAVAAVVELGIGHATIGCGVDRVAGLAVEVHARVPARPLRAWLAELACDRRTPGDGVAVVRQVGLGLFLGLARVRLRRGSVGEGADGGDRRDERGAGRAVESGVAGVDDRRGEWLAAAAGARLTARLAALGRAGEGRSAPREHDGALRHDQRGDDEEREREATHGTCLPVRGRFGRIQARLVRQK